MTHRSLGPLFLLLGLLLGRLASAGPMVVNTSEYLHGETGIRVVGGDLALPSEGSWSIDAESGPANAELFLLVPEVLRERAKGVEDLHAKESRLRSQDSRLFHRLSSAIKQYAQTHDGVGPDSAEQLKGEELKSAESRRKYHLIPSLQIMTKDQNGKLSNARPGVPVAFELTPLIGDGKHWVLFSDGRTVLMDVDAAMVAASGVEITPRGLSVDQRLAAIPAKVDYRVLGRRPPGAGKDLVFKVVNADTGERLTIRWPLERVTAGDLDLFRAWGEQRVLHWLRPHGTGLGGLLGRWTAIAARQYGITERLSEQRTGQSRAARRRARGEQQPGLFNLLGGRSAMRETFQLQALAGDGSRKVQATLPISDIEGVEVKSHPYAEMLDGGAGGRLGMADLAPADRLFAWFADADALLQFIDAGADFLFRGAVATGGEAGSYDLVQRSMARLGLSDGLARAFLHSGAAGEIALLLPDLFLRDGTDMTVVIRLNRTIGAMVAGLALPDKVERRVNSDGTASYWVKRDGLLVISSHEGELRDVVNLIDSGGKGSLGRSEEFRYMLTKLPVQAQTRSLLYFSDPFIRRLVGPQVKIGQLRRLLARHEMERAIAARLLYRYDGGAGAPDVAALVAHAYLSSPRSATDLRMTADGAAASDRFGSAAALKTLLELPVTEVTREEQRAYEAYRQRYTRFWSRFFDPIAIRVNQSSATEMEAETFILPLIENSIYESLRGVIAASDSGAPLYHPRMDPEPVASLSLNLGEGMVGKAAGKLQKFLRKTLGIPANLVDYLASDIHLAVGDSDPIVVVGSGELMGSFDRMLGRRGDFGDLMFPLLGALLTRPSTLLIGLKDPVAVKRILRRLPESVPMTRGLFGMGEATLNRVAGRDAWRYHLSYAGLISMRIGIEVKDRYLAISNQPLSFDPTITAVEGGGPGGAALAFAPASAIRQLPALYASSHDRLRAAARNGMADLYPVLLAEGGDVPRAQRRLKQLLGYAPMHPDGGDWTWDTWTLRSSLYGSRDDPQLPEYPGGDAGFGVLRGIDRIQLSMQFEDDGLRALCKWTPRADK